MTSRVLKATYVNSLKAIHTSVDRYFRLGIGYMWATTLNIVFSVIWYVI